ncbi:MAG TPA: DUF4437 domain-containing protein [Steroidobacteraceae bacterium]
MSRPWIEFIQSQNLPWQSGDLGGMRAGVQFKQLSVDRESGACSLLVRYPAGWRAEAGALAVDDEFLVLEGTLRLGEFDYAPMSYAHLPAGFDPGPRASAAGAVVIEFFSGRPAAAPAGADYDESRLVRHQDAFVVPYTGNFHPEFPPGAGRKLLYTDPETRDTTWILGTLPMRWAERAEIHPTVEEMYLISGEVHGNRGVMRPGAYFWRPPSKPHGPYGTRTGNLYLFRTKGGVLATDYVEPERKFRWWPEFDPVLPPELEAYRGEGPRAPACW